MALVDVRCNTHATGETISLSLERDISIKTRIPPLPSQSLARARLNLDLRSGSGEQHAPSMLVLTEKGNHEKGKRERALYGKQEFSRKNNASQCLRTIERTPRLGAALSHPFIPQRVEKRFSRKKDC